MTKKFKVIAIMSCKGGVGKTTTAVNLALYFSNFLKKKVGLFDADIYGPNHLDLLGIKDNEKKLNINNEYLIPFEVYNLKSMSMGYFLNNESAVLLRGPMISNTVLYLLNKTIWGELDYLIIDFPPGTGDIYFSIFKNFKIDYVFLVTLPNVLSVIDTKKTIYMLKKFDISIFAVLENMKFYKCKNCNFSENIYGKDDDIKTLIIENDIKFYYEMPFYIDINRNNTFKRPVILETENKDILSVYEKIYLDISNN